MAIATHWRVEVYADGERILAIEPEMVSGADITDDYADTIRHCAAHLIGFVGQKTMAILLNLTHNSALTGDGPQAGVLVEGTLIQRGYMGKTKRRKRQQMRLGTLSDHQYKDGTVRDGTPQYSSPSCEHHGRCKWCERNRTFSSRKRLADDGV